MCKKIYYKDGKRYKYLCTVHSIKDILYYKLCTGFMVV